MPAKLNVGLSRKIGEANYSSRGANVNLEVELDASVVNEPQRLRERIRKLFSLVRVAVQEELEACGPSNGASGDNGASTPSPTGSEWTCRGCCKTASAACGPMTRHCGMPANTSTN